MTFPETGDLWEYIPRKYCGIYLIMEPVAGKDKTFNILALDSGEVIEYHFGNYAIDLWRKAA